MVGLPRRNRKKTGHFLKPHRAAFARPMSRKCLKENERVVGRRKSALPWALLINQPGPLNYRTHLSCRPHLLRFQTYSFLELLFIIHA